MFLKQDGLLYRVTCISASGNQTALVTVKGRLVVFGANKYGCFGMGHNVPVMTPAEVSQAPHLSKISARNLDLKLGI